METKFIRFLAADGVELQGLIFKPDSVSANSKCIIHIHGLAGNFYENSFLDTLANYYTDAGYLFLTFNNRGHDYISDLVVVDGEKSNSIKGGGAFEVFEECIFDIQGAINYLDSLDIHEFYLQGHSSGANKIVYYSYKIGLVENIKAVLLLSPCDDTGLLISHWENDYYETLNDAEEMINHGKGSKLVEKSFFSYPMSAKSYYNNFKKSASQDVFPYRDKQKPFTELASITKPLFIRFGTDNEYLLLSFEETEEIIREKSNSIDLNIGLIEGASHSYSGRGKELALEALEWLKNLSIEH